MTETLANENETLRDQMCQTGKRYDRCDFVFKKTRSRKKRRSNENKRKYRDEIFSLFRSNV